MEGYFDDMDEDEMYEEIFGTKNEKVEEPKCNFRESKGERTCRKVLEDIYKRKFPTVRPDFLKNPETKRNLELDGFNKDLMIAFEYNGEQHYHYPNCFHKTEEDFRKQVRRDKYKFSVCEELGIYLIRIPYTVKNDDIRRYIEERLP